MPIFSFVRPRKNVSFSPRIFATLPVTAPSYTALDGAPRSGLGALQIMMNSERVDKRRGWKRFLLFPEITAATPRLDRGSREANGFAGLQRATPSERRAQVETVIVRKSRQRFNLPIWILEALRLSSRAPAPRHSAQLSL